MSACGSDFERALGLMLPAHVGDIGLCERCRLKLGRLAAGERAALQLLA